MSQALADRAVAKLESLDGAASPRRVALGEAEVQSLLEYRMKRSLPPYLHDPHIEMIENGMRVRARVPKSAMPELPGAGDMVSLLPDTTEVSARTQILPLGGGRVALSVDEISAARIPLPQRMIPSLLRRVGRRDEPGLPQDAIAVRLPNGVCSAYVHADSLVLLGRGGATDCR